MSHRKDELSVYGYYLETSIEIFLHQNGYRAFKPSSSDSLDPQSYHKALSRYVSDSRVVILDINLSDWSGGDSYEELVSCADIEGAWLAICHPLGSSEMFRTLDEYEQLRYVKVACAHEGACGISLEEFLENLILTTSGGRGESLWHGEILDKLNRSCISGNCYPLFIAINQDLKQLKILSLQEIWKLSAFRHL